MASREFSPHYLKELVDCEQHLDTLNRHMDHDAAQEFMDLVFQSDEDGKYYRFEYWKSDQGDMLQNLGQRATVVCTEVLRTVKTVETVTWVPA